jgi:hypothetical protein
MSIYPAAIGGSASAAPPPARAGARRSARGRGRMAGREHGNAIEQEVFWHSVDLFKLDVDLIFYDATAWLECDEEDVASHGWRGLTFAPLRKRGHSMEGRDPVGCGFPQPRTGGVLSQAQDHRARDPADVPLDAAADRGPRQALRPRADDTAGVRDRRRGAMVAARRRPRAPESGPLHRRGETIVQASRISPELAAILKKLDISRLKPILAVG